MQRAFKLGKQLMTRPRCLRGHITIRAYWVDTQDELRESIKACLDKTRAVVRLEGPQTIQFLQGMVTNDMRPLEAPGAAPVYAAMLTPEGTFLHDVIFYKQQDGALLMEVDVAGKQRAMDWLARHKLDNQVDVRDVSSDQAVFVKFGDSTQYNAAEQQEGWWWDPRLQGLGLRTVKPRSFGVSWEHGANQYRTWRHILGVAEGEVEIPTGKASPLEYNMDTLHGVSYTKGSYMGQERTTSTHHQGAGRMRCVPFECVRLGDEAKPVQGEEVVNESGEVVGTVQGLSSGYGLLYGRFKSILPYLGVRDGGPQLELRGKLSKGIVEPFRRDWWDKSWCHEE